MSAVAGCPLTPVIACRGRARRAMLGAMRGFDMAPPVCALALLAALGGAAPAGPRRAAEGGRPVGQDAAARSPRERVEELGARAREAVRAALGAEVDASASWRWLDAEGWLTGSDAGALALVFTRPGGQLPLATWLLAPWQPLAAREPLARAQLTAVLADALVLEGCGAVDRGPGADRLRQAIAASVARSLDLDAHRAVLGTALDAEPPDGLAVMGAELRRRSVSLRVAVPGSRPVPPEEIARAVSRGRMVELLLLPDRGEPKLLLVPPPREGEGGGGGEVGPRSGAADAGSRQRVPPAASAEPFAGYQPKRTPDTAADFRPGLAAALEALPPATVASLPALLSTLADQQARARASPGAHAEGNPLLGGARRQYVPSDPELLESELGERIRRVAASATAAELREVLRAAGRRGGAVDYRAVTFDHVDVMGSGRFTYASEPQAARVDLPDVK